MGVVAVLALGTLAVPIVGESQSVPGFREIGQGARIRYFSRSESKLDRRGRADLARTDAYLGRLESLLDQRLASPIEYYRYERPEDVAVQTGVYATGLTHIGDTVVHSTLDYHPHELVHAVAGQLGDPGRLFHEGLAVALGDEGRWAGRRVDALAASREQPLDWRGLRDVFQQRDVDTAYTLAGSFVTSLIDSDGLPQLAAFFRRCANPKRVEAAFLATYGRSLDEAVADWRKGLGGRKDFPTPGNASRIAMGSQGSVDTGNTLADLRLVHEAPAGTGPAIEKGMGGRK